MKLPPALFDGKARAAEAPLVLILRNWISVTALVVPPTVKIRPLLATPPTVTTTGPVVVPFGTGTTMLVGLQLVGAAMVPLKKTELIPCGEPKLTPVMVTMVPAD